MLILNETIRVDLIVFLAIFADVATIAIAYDRASYAKPPVEWELPEVWVISTIMALSHRDHFRWVLLIESPHQGLILAAGTWAIRRTLLRGPTGGIIQNFGSVREILFLEVALTESWLLAAVSGVDIFASLFCLSGWISGDATHQGHVDIVTVVRIWCFSFGITVVVALAYYVMNKWSWLGRLGRLKKNEKLENFLAELQRLTIHHQSGLEGDDYYRIGVSETQKESEEDNEHKSKGASAKKKEGKAKNDEQSADADGGGEQARESQNAESGEKEDDGAGDGGRGSINDAQDSKQQH
ncbi:hypothetical protein C8R45DRAFT_1110101 [Mycena sanguinolenta]|nr:hypothetical protein C8R45DRAFT_1110101 [Mycena sanguinolenta]